jgi:ubiquitin C-terminal hydrolase
MPIDKSIARVEGRFSKMELKECLEYFAYSNQLDGQNEWFCPKCRKYVSAISLISLWSVPDVLIFHLKRFGVRDGVVKKSTAKVDFPEEIDMAPFVQGPQKAEDLRYRLFAVIHHLGTMCGGHYITIIRSAREGWYTYNDDAVYTCNEKAVFSETAYVLLYERKNPPASYIKE